MFSCLNCGAPLTARKGCMNMYCDNSCQAAKRSRDIVGAWLGCPSPDNFYHKGSQIRVAIRRHLLAESAHACQICGWDKLHPLDGKSTLEVDHVDGDWHNCDPSNLKVICPNCHSLTRNYKGRNKGSGREYRRGANRPNQKSS